MLVTTALTSDAGSAADPADTQSNALVGDTPKALSFTDLADNQRSDLAAIVEYGVASNQASAAASSFVGTVAETGSSNDGASFWTGNVDEALLGMDAADDAASDLTAVVEYDVVFDLADEVASQYLTQASEALAAADSLTGFNGNQPEADEAAHRRCHMRRQPVPWPGGRDGGGGCRDRRDAHPSGSHRGNGHAQP